MQGVWRRLHRKVGLGKAGLAAMGQRADVLDSLYQKRMNRRWEERMQRAGNFEAIKDGGKRGEKIREEKRWVRGRG